MLDINQTLDAIDAAFGRDPNRRTCDYSFRPGDRVQIGDAEITIRSSDFADVGKATALELAVVFLAEGVDVEVVNDVEGFKRLEPRPTIRKADV